MDEHLARVLLAAGGTLALEEARARCARRTRTEVPDWMLLASVERMQALDELFLTDDQQLVLLPAAYETWRD